MATFKKFEDIEAWQKARQLTKQIYRVSRTGGFARDFGLSDQIRRASVSIMSNIAEGYDRSGTGEFIQFRPLRRAQQLKLSVNYVALDEGYINNSTFDDLSKLVTEIGNMIGGLTGYLRRSGIKGPKYKAAMAQ